MNLRFYVRRRGFDGVMRRAVVFVRELVPRVAIAWTARAIYNEPYLAVPMSHAIALDHGHGGRAQYYGPHFADLLRTAPRSAFVAVGSAVEVHVGQRIPRRP